MFPNRAATIRPPHGAVNTVGRHRSSARGSAPISWTPGPFEGGRGPTGRAAGAVRAVRARQAVRATRAARCSPARPGTWPGRPAARPAPHRVPARSTSRAAASAISASGCRTVVSGGLIQRASGRSSKPTTLRSRGMRRPQLAGGLVQPERLEVVAGEDRGGAVGQPQQFAARGVAGLVVEVAAAHQRRVEAHARASPARPGSRRSWPGRTSCRPGRRSRRSCGGRAPAGGGWRPARPASWWRRSRARPGPGSPAGSSTTNGMPRLESWSRWAGVAAQTARGSPRSGGGPARRPPRSAPGSAGPRTATAPRSGPPGAPRSPRPRITSIAQGSPARGRPGRSAARAVRCRAAPVAVPAQQLLDPAAGGGRDVGPAVEHLRNGRSRDACRAGDLGEGGRTAGDRSGDGCRFDGGYGPGCRFGCGPGWRRRRLAGGRGRAGGTHGRDRSPGPEPRRAAAEPGQPRMIANFPHPRGGWP